MLSGYAQAKRTEEALARLLREVDELAEERLGHAERARRRIEGERDEAVKRSWPEASRRHVQLEAEVRAMVRAMPKPDRLTYLRRAVAAGDGLSVSALLSAPAALVDLGPAEAVEHERAQWEARVAPREVAALADLAKAEETAAWAVAQFRRLVGEDMRLAGPGRPAA